MIPLAAIPWRLIGYGVLAAALIAGTWFAVHRLGEWKAAYAELPVVQEALKQERLCAPSTACQKRAEALAEQARLEAEKRATDALEAVRKAEEKARADAAAWRRKYQAALASDPECAKWSSQPISCPL